jgi:hypothetical protein
VLVKCGTLKKASSLLYGIRAEDEEEKSMDNYSLLRTCLSGEPKQLNERSNCHA